MQQHTYADVQTISWLHNSSTSGAVMTKQCAQQRNYASTCRRPRLKITPPLTCTHHPSHRQAHCRVPPTKPAVYAYRLTGTQEKNVGQ